MIDDLAHTQNVKPISDIKSIEGESPLIDFDLHNELLSLSFRMAEIGAKMNNSDDHEVARHGRELSGAARKVLTWIAGMG